MGCQGRCAVLTLCPRDIIDVVSPTERIATHKDCINPKSTNLKTTDRNLSSVLIFGESQWQTATEGTSTQGIEDRTINILNFNTLYSSSVCVLPPFPSPHYSAPTCKASDFQWGSLNNKILSQIAVENGSHLTLLKFGDLWFESLSYCNRIAVPRRSKSPVVFDSRFEAQNPIALNHAIWSTKLPTLTSNLAFFHW